MDQQGLGLLRDPDSKTQKLRWRKKTPDTDLWSLLAYVHVPLHTYVCAHTHVYTHMYTHTDLWSSLAYVHVPLHTYVHACVRTHMYTHKGCKRNAFDNFIVLLILLRTSYFVHVTLNMSNLVWSQQSQAWLVMGWASLRYNLIQLADKTGNLPKIV